MAGTQLTAKVQLYTILVLRAFRHHEIFVTLKLHLITMKFQFYKLNVFFIHGESTASREFNEHSRI